MTLRIKEIPSSRLINQLTSLRDNFVSFLMASLSLDHRITAFKIKNLLFTILILISPYVWTQEFSIKIFF
jgi:hypothetical protein